MDEADLLNEEDFCQDGDDIPVDNGEMEATNVINPTDCGQSSSRCGTLETKFAGMGDIELISSPDEGGASGSNLQSEVVLCIPARSSSAIEVTKKDLPGKH